MADTIGFEQSMTLTTRSRASRITRMRAASSSMIASTSSKLPPAENALARTPEERDVHVRVAVDGPPHVGQLRGARRGVDGVEARARRA